MKQGVKPPNFTTFYAFQSVLAGSAVSSQREDGQVEDWQFDSGSIRFRLI